MRSYRNLFPHLMTTALERLIFYLRQRKIGDIIRRRDIIGLGGKSIDNYRNYLTKAGYLRIVSPGAYEILREVPEDLTTTQLVKQAYPHRTLTHI